MMRKSINSAFLKKKIALLISLHLSFQFSLETEFNTAYCRSDVLCPTSFGKLTKKKEGKQIEVYSAICLD